MPRRLTSGQKQANGPSSVMANWPATSVEMWELSRILPYENNPRKHPPAQIALLAGSMLEEGVTMPILVDEAGVIIAGHGRRMAAEQNGFAEYPVVIAKGWSDDKKRAARIRDNSISLLSTWDAQLIQGEISNLKLSGYNIPLLGFPETQMLAWGFSSGTTGEVDPEITPEPPKKPVVRRGDLWCMDSHRLLCGDSTKTEDVARLMQNETAMLMATDPPYGVAYDNALRPNPGVAKPRVAKPRVANDELVEGPAMQAFLESMLRAALPHMDKHAAFYFWHPMLTQGTYVAAAAAAAGILIHRQIIWVKPVLLLGRGDYHWRHELCFYGWQQGNRPPFYGPRNQDTIWEVASVTHKERKEMNHATPKPVALWDKPISNHTKVGEIVYEPFSGSGTQIIAAEMKGRKCYALEFDPANTQVAIERWQRFTNHIATLDGKTLEQVAKARRKGQPKAISVASPPPVA